MGWVGKLCVAMFCFLGGYGTYLACAKKKTFEEKQSVIVSKIKGLYKIFWSVFVIFIPICMLTGVERVTKDITSFVLNFLALNTSYNGEWWFITSYLILLILYLLFHRVIEKKRGITVEIAGIVVCNVLLVLVVPQIMTLQVFSRLSISLQWTKFYAAISLLPAFTIGCVFAKYDIFRWIKEKTQNKWTYSILSCVIIAIILLMRTRVNTEYDYIFVPILCAAILVLFQGRMFRGIRWILEKIGNESTYIWLIHSFYCYMLCQELVFLPKITCLILIWLVVLCYVTAIIIKKGEKVIWRAFSAIKRT